MASQGHREAGIGPMIKCTLQPDSGTKHVSPGQRMTNAPHKGERPPVHSSAYSPRSNSLRLAGSTMRYVSTGHRLAGE
eukprot:3564819-Rhodomonas_salina.2